jgi:predicted dehydrogenase/threonine dehydrogenase-like Zn-dependent dehydrogenase
MMKQVVQDIRTGETSILEVPVPKPAPGTALVRTAASLVSAGTERTLVEFAGKSLLGKARSRPDLVRQTVDKARREGLVTTIEAVQNRLDQPIPLGYSSSGIVVAVGDELHGFRVGDRVACAGGGYAVHAEFAVVPQNLLVQLPDNVDFESGAFTTLGAIALHGFRLAEPQLGERVAVIGLGLLGLLAVGVARSAGCSVFGTDLDPSRVEAARRMGAVAVLRDQAEEAVSSFSRGSGCDVVLICADTPSDDPVELAGSIARDRARVIAVGAVGMNIPRRTYYQKELTFLISRAYGPGRYDPEYEEGGKDYPQGYVRWTEGRNLAAFVDLLGANQLDVKALISHRFPIERASDAYDLISGEKDEPSLAVLFSYPTDSEREVRQERTTVLFERETLPSEPVRLGVLGAGNFATAVLLPALKGVRGVEFVGLAAASGLNSASVGRRFKFRFATTNEKEIINEPSVNTVAVLTRHHLHAPQVIAALQAGKHVFCEKPLALNEEELADITSALHAGEQMLMVGFNRRFAPLAVRMKELLGRVDEPLAIQYRINAGYLPPDHWLHDPAQGGGRIKGEVCHFIDFLTYIVGELPVRVHTHGLPDGDRYLEDNVVITIEFPAGSLGMITYIAAGDRAYPKERIEVFGGGRVTVLDDFRRLETSSGGRRKVWRSWLKQDKGHRGEWAAFVNALSTGGPPPIPYEQLYAVTMASFAAVESLRSHEAKSLNNNPQV